MNNELMLYARGYLPVRRGDRQVAKLGKQIYDETRVAGLKATATLALASHMMEGISELDQHRKRLAGDDPMLNALLGQIEMGAIRKLSGIQTSLFTGF